MKQEAPKILGRRRMRKHKRRSVELPVTIRRGDGGTTGEIMFDTTDLSLGGAFLRSTVLFEVDEELDLEFAVAAGETIRARARVVRVSADPPGMGISFVLLGEGDRDALRGFLRKGG